MLLRLRQEGHSYAAIADSIQKELNVSVTPNALVKRYHKIQELYLEVSSVSSFPGLLRLSCGWTRGRRLTLTPDDFRSLRSHLPKQLKTSCPKSKPPSRPKWSVWAWVSQLWIMRRWKSCPKLSTNGCRIAPLAVAERCRFRSRLDWCCGDACLDVELMGLRSFEVAYFSWHCIVHTRLGARGYSPLFGDVRFFVIVCNGKRCG
jgi:hypothetical protein